MTTWTSLRKPFGKSGRSGRSVRRALRIASVAGRPSRRKNAAGDLADGVHLLFVVDGEGEEVGPRSRAPRHRRGAEHYGIAVGHGDGAAGEASDASCFDCQCLAAELAAIAPNVSHVGCSLLRVVGYSVPAEYPHGSRVGVTGYGRLHGGVHDSLIWGCVRANPRQGASSRGTSFRNVGSAAPGDAAYETTPGGRLPYFRRPSFARTAR